MRVRNDVNFWVRALGIYRSCGWSEGQTTLPEHTIALDLVLNGFLYGRRNILHFMFVTYGADFFWRTCAKRALLHKRLLASLAKHHLD